MREVELPEGHGALVSSAPSHAQDVGTDGTHLGADDHVGEGEGGYD